jgi:hypothetical protein
VETFFGYLNVSFIVTGTVSEEKIFERTMASTLVPFRMNYNIVLICLPLEMRIHMRKPNYHEYQDRCSTVAHHRGAVGITIAGQMALALRGKDSCSSLISNNSLV